MDHGTTEDPRHAFRDAEPRCDPEKRGRTGFHDKPNVTETEYQSAVVVVYDQSARPADGPGETHPVPEEGHVQSQFHLIHVFDSHDCTGKARSVVRILPSRRLRRAGLLFIEMFHERLFRLVLPFLESLADK